jgi:hypothetical protein
MSDMMELLFLTLSSPFPSSVSCEHVRPGKQHQHASVIGRLALTCWDVRRQCLISNAALFNNPPLKGHRLDPFVGTQGRCNAQTHLSQLLHLHPAAAGEGRSHRVEQQTVHTKT